MVFKAKQQILIHSGREKKIHFVVAPDELINDMRISAKAKVLLLYMLNQSMSWQFYTKQLARHFGVSRQCISRWMGELKKYRYVEVTKHQAKENSINFVYLYEVYPLPKERYWHVFKQWEAYRASIKKNEAAPENIVDIRGVL